MKRPVFNVMHQAVARKWSGYSLIEGLVTISIITILSAILTRGLIEARRTAIVKTAAEQFAGHLRETGTLAQSSIKAQGCGTDADCSRYRITFTAGGDTYTRETVNGVAQTQFKLPDGVIFQSGGTIAFEYKPPVVLASPAGAYLMRHREASGVQATICLGQLATVEVLPNCGAFGSPLPSPTAGANLPSLYRSKNLFASMQPVSPRLLSSESSHF